MDEAEKNAKWQELLRREKEARLLAHEVQDATTKLRQQALQEWWGIVSDVLRIYLVALAQGANPDPPPREVLVVLELAARYLAVGQIPDHIADVAARGQHRPGPDLARDKGIAAAYMRATGPGGFQYLGKTIAIADKTPTKTVSQAFGIDGRTARNWKSCTIPPVFGEDNLDGETLTAFMREAGVRYKEAGASQSAILTRARAANK
jgi:hypothetical protein